MKAKYALIIGIVLILVGSMLFIHNDSNQEVEYNYTTDLYYGPVPLGYNQTHYWKFGEMIELNNDEQVLK